MLQQLAYARIRPGYTRGSGARPQALGARRTVPIAATATATSTLTVERPLTKELPVVEGPLTKELPVVEGPLTKELPVVQRAPAPRRPPGELDATRFRLDDSVRKWSNPSRPYAPVSKTSFADALQRYVTAATAAGDIQAVAFWAYHTARYMFFATQALGLMVAHAVVGRVDSGDIVPSRATSLPLPKLNDVQREVAVRLLECLGTWQQDLGWIQAGVYKLPWDMATPNKQFNPFHLLTSMAEFLKEGTGTLQRHMRDDGQSTWLRGPAYPQYYTKTFHFQRDGWLSDGSAQVYEHSTETLFLGGQDAMQRMSLVPISEYLASRRDVPVSEMRLLEVAAGTGRFHTFVKDNWPTMRSVCSDLSPFYLQRARANMQEWKALRKPNLRLGGTDGTGVDFMQAAAESLGAPDESFDIVVCVYLFHEMPEAARRKAVAEWFRVLKPGGLCVFTDSVQLGDRADWGTNVYTNFGDFNEPYYVNYAWQDLGAMFEEAGFRPGTKYLSSASKTLSFTKPE